MIALLIVYVCLVAVAVVLLARSGNGDLGALLAIATVIGLIIAVTIIRSDDVRRHHLTTTTTLTPSGDHVTVTP